MKLFFTILVLVCSACSQSAAQTQNAATPAPGPKDAAKASPSPAIALDKEAVQNSDKAKAIIEQGIQALGGEIYLTIRDREQQGRGYGFHHGNPTGGGGPFWSFSEFPDKERVEFTKERDIAQVFVGDKGYEITFKGPHPVEQKDLDDYLRRRHYSLDRVLRTWINDPGVVMLFEGNAIAAQHSAYQVTLVNAQNESVTLYFDTDSHLPIKKSFEWRDPVDKQKNLEEEVYDNYRPVSGIMAPHNVTRYFNGDMSNQRYLTSVTINQGLDPAMFDPNSGYNPNKQVKSNKSKK
ncbi:MAG TPA: hypothetical protein VNX87_11400 [Candidatus Sulfotelmatobacter sp.]|jgi:hypothetical protein|nr:hypothetical protein [Candidatus Sulfotelmatobacter sp.]